MSSINFEHQMDAKGLFCPEPVMMLHDEIKKMLVGESIEIQATDP
ncbi:sulfurtransferase TusA, partial [Oleispira antarctica]